MSRDRTRLILAVLAVVAVAVLATVLLVVGPGAPGAAPSPSPSVAIGPTPSLTPGEAPTPGASEVPSEVPSESAAPPDVGPPPPPPPVDEGTPEPCGTFDPRCNRLPVDGAGAAFTPDLPCGELGTCRLTIGVAYPRSGGPWPVVVVIPGGPKAPSSDAYLGDFAGSVASQGAVVFVADYRATPQWGGGAPTSYKDIACAIRYARENAAQWGGDGSRVTLVGHSFGTFSASVVALSPEPFEPDPGTCVATTGSTKPDAFVGIAGVYAFKDISQETLTSFFGGTADQVPAAWAAGDPYALIAAKDNATLPVRLVHGLIDTNVQPRSSEELLAALQAAGYDSTLTLVERSDHSGVLQNHHTVQVVMETALGLKP